MLKQQSRRLHHRDLRENQPQEIDLLQGQPLVALRHAGQDSPGHAEEQFGIQHIAQLEGKAPEIGVVQDGIVVDRGPLGSVGDHIGVGIIRGTELDGGDKQRPRQENPETQHDLDAGQGDVVAVPVKEVERAEDHRLHQQVQKHIVAVKIDVLAGGVVGVEIGGLCKGAEGQCQHERQHQHENHRRGKAVGFPRYPIESFHLHARFSLSI